MSVAEMELRVIAASVVLLLVGTASAGTNNEKPVTQPPQTPPTKPAPSSPPVQSPTDNMETLDYVRSGALVVAFLATAFAGQDIWMLTNLIVVSAFGAAFYFYPDALLAYHTKGKLDAVHLFLGQIYGGFLLSMAVAIYFARKSRQEGVRTAVFISALLTGLTMLQSLVLDYFKASGDNQSFTQPTLSFSALGCGLWVLGNLIAIFKAMSFGGSSVTMHSALGKHLLIDLVMYTSVAFMHYGYPDIGFSFIAKKGVIPDGIHAHLLRSIGAVLFGTAIYAFQAISFLDDRDKRAHLLSRLAMFGLCFPVSLLYQIKFNMSPPLFINVLSAIQVLNALLGYFGPVSMPKLKLR